MVKKECREGWARGLLSIGRGQSAASGVVSASVFGGEDEDETGGDDVGGGVRRWAA